ncbi:hypothetical protein NM688_g8068 [Phlebia brevispora]|uniref:Uncharacterized protein n=1 Tax=Phlebia brevispora TaxID=194682 RepID=A0ACC1RXQ5_9APHY|nr:hypothetical protein NM688_g8068 [Phlebia brevispora]
MLSADVNTSQPFHEVLLDKVKDFDFEHVAIHMPLRDAFLSIVGVGFIVYLIFKRWEPTNLPLLAFLLLLTPASLSTLVTPHLGSVKGTALSILTYWATILISVTFYRLSPFHPLARYPGPIMCKLTKFWGFYKELDGKQHLYIESLHDKYGDVVRIGKRQSKRDIPP